MYGYRSFSFGKYKKTHEFKMCDCEHDGQAHLFSYIWLKFLNLMSIAILQMHVQPLWSNCQQWNCLHLTEKMKVKIWKITDDFNAFDVLMSLVDLLMHAKNYICKFNRSEEIAR